MFVLDNVLYKQNKTAHLPTSLQKKRHFLIYFKNRGFNCNLGLLHINPSFNTNPHLNFPVTLTSPVNPTLSLVCSLCIVCGTFFLHFLCREDKPSPPALNDTSVGSTVSFCGFNRILRQPIREIEYSYYKEEV